MRKLFMLTMLTLSACANPYEDAKKLGTIEGDTMRF